ncbi:MAG: hypothetical protein HYW86_03005 [Candidatus Roizmanbacteria bacterium]|nr:MAG: hypothetical protein HYW86_03005 [Candidatus Roizmanbacteria bacterium]
MGFYKHTIEELDGKVFVQKKVDDDKVNKLILAIVVALAVMFTLLIALPDVSSGKKPLTDLILALVLIFVGGSIGGIAVKLVLTFILPFVSPKVILDNKTQLLSTSNGSLDIKFSDVEDVLITEKAAMWLPINFVTLKLKSGQTSLPFNFISYNEAKSVQERIKVLIMKKGDLN